MNHILDAGGFPETGMRDLDDAPAAPRAGWSIPWERAIRCLLLIAILAVAGHMAWRPALLRFSQLMFMVSPSHGDSLAWKPEEEPLPLRLAPRHETPEPPEWRPTAGARGDWRAERSASGLDGRPLWRGVSQLPARWQRISDNPWNWRDDAIPPQPQRADVAPPAQKPATDFRAKATDAWGTVAMAAPEPQPDETDAVEAPASTRHIPSISSLPGVGTATESTPPGPEQGDSANATEELPPLRIPELSPPADPAGATETHEENAAGQTDWTRFVVPPPQPATDPAATRILDQASNGEVLVSTPVFSEPPSAPQPASPIDAPESADWKNQEIAGPIAGAYLTIYPKLKFIGLCVPGQGYIRKYNQVAAPGDTTNEKVAAADGRTPYGKYYIAARSRDGDGARLVLSWPSPDDARRLGLDPGQTALIEDAWLGQSLPPQDTPAGGGVALTGLRDRQDATAGGFALEPPHMEEIYTALPNGAWVFIQE